MDWKELLEGKTKLEKGTDEKIQNGEAGREHTGDIENVDKNKFLYPLKYFPYKPLNRKSCIFSTLTYV